MSFNFQGPGEMPIIRGAQNMMNNGGGGNLGYFQGRQKKKEKEDVNIFNTEEEDTFTLSSGDDENLGDMPDEPSLKDKLKGFFDKFKGEKSSD